MRPITDPKLRAITLSEIERLKEAGYHPLDYGDASKANSDYFMIMERDGGDGKRHVKIVCPSFLRGTLGFSVQGAVSY